MAHHGYEAPDEMKQAALEQLLGPTKKYPMGKLCEEDAGEIVIGIAADLNNDLVVVNLGSPVSWLGLTPEQAQSIGGTLIAKAMTIKTTAH